MFLLFGCLFFRSYLMLKLNTRSFFAVWQCFFLQVLFPPKILISFTIFPVAGILAFRPTVLGSYSNLLLMCVKSDSNSKRSISYYQAGFEPGSKQYICHGKFQTSLRILRWSKFALNLLSYPFLNHSILSQIKKVDEELNY